MRNRVIHAATSHTTEMPNRRKALVDFDRFLEGRLKVKAKNYPRALLAKVGQEELEKRGWVNTAMRQFIATAVAEPHPFYLPRDLAGG